MGDQTGVAAMVIMTCSVVCGSVVRVILKSAKTVFGYMLCVGINEEVVGVRVENTCVRKGLEELR